VDWISDNNPLSALADQLILPRNCSIGTARFCVGSSDSVACYDLPATVSDLIPSETIRTSLIGYSLDNIISPSLEKVTRGNIMAIWIAGLVSESMLVTLAGLAVFSNWVLFRNKALRVIIHITVGMIICLPFILPVLALRTFNSIASSLPQWIEISYGGVPSLFASALGTSTTIVFLNGVIQYLVESSYSNHSLK